MNEKVCDYCYGEAHGADGEVYPIQDPWGGFHGWICDVCNDNQAEQQALGEV